MELRKLFVSTVASYGAQASRAPVDWAIMVLLGSGFLLHFVLRGSINATLVIIFLLCAWRWAREGALPIRRLADRRVAWIVVAFAAPLLAVSSVQLLRHEFVPRYFDGPMRLLMSGLIMLYLVDRPLNFVRIAGFVFPIAVLLCAALVFLYPGASQYYWGGRVATYFIDPLILAQHITIAGFICLFAVDCDGEDSRWLRALKYGAFVAAIMISLGTQSRTGWVMVPILLAVWLIGIKGHSSIARSCLALLAVGASSVAAYWLSEAVHLRVDNAVDDIAQFLAGTNVDTSLGIRARIYKTIWILFLDSPLYGWGFGTLPALASHPDIAAFSTPLFEHFFIMSGGHNELLQSMLRMGILGLASRVLLLVVPLVIFIRAAGSPRPRQRAAGFLGVVVLIGYLTSGLSSEVFNLIYAASFYGLLVAALAAAALSEDQSWTTRPTP